MKTIATPTPIAATTNTPITIPINSSSDMDNDVGGGAEIEAVDDAEEEDVELQIFSPETQAPLLHVSFTVQALESLQGVPFGRFSTKHPTIGLQVELWHGLDG